jgi:methionyl aminopeptidase
MIRLKSVQDLIYIKKAIKIGESILDEIEQFIYPERNLIDLNALIGGLIKDKGGIPSFFNYNGFIGNACLSINEEIIHGLPSNRKLQNGDVVKIDIGINYNGYFSDQARTYIVGKAKNSEHQILVDICKESLERASALAKVGNNLINISEEIEHYAKSWRIGILQGFGGHGVGFEVHEEPFVPNYAPYNDVELKMGMVICIEPMFVLGKGTYKVAENGWTIITDGIGAHEEKTVITV